jgi:hypothetical protein
MLCHDESRSDIFVRSETRRSDGAKQDHDTIPDLSSHLGPGSQKGGCHFPSTSSRFITRFVGILLLLVRYPIVLS